jgi:Fe(3+) dicitrate transport protein
MSPGRILVFAATFLFAAPLFAQPAPSAAPSAPAPLPVPQGSSQEPPAAPAAPAPPAAAEATAPVPEPIEVRVIGDKADALQKVPGSGTLVTAKEIARAEPFDVAEMLRRVPGLTVRQEEAGGLRLDIGVRGLDPGRARRVLVLEDGIPVAINHYAESDLYYAPPIERMRGIEVVKGSGSILFGPQTVGGVINFITLAPPVSRRIVAEVSGGDGGYVKALASYGDSFQGARWLVQAFYKRGDGVRNEAFQSADVFAKVAFDTSERGQATIKIGIHDESAQSSDIGLTREMFAEDPRRGTIAPNDKVAVRRYEVSLIHDLRLQEATDLRTLVYGYVTTRLWNRQDWTRAPQPGVVYERVTGDPLLPNGAVFFGDKDSILDRTYEVAGIEPRLEHRFSTRGIGHTLDVGARFLVETGQLLQRVGDTPTSTSGDLTGDERHRTVAIAAYAEDRIAFRDDILVTPGVRFEHARFHREIRRDYVDGTPTDIDRQGDSDVTGLIPGVGMVFGQPEHHVFGGLHLGWSPPRIASSINPQGHSALLDAERALIYEVGARLAYRRLARLEATGFLSNFENQIISSTNFDTARTELVNGGKTQHYGVEAGATLRFGQAFKLGFDLDLGGSYTFARAVFVDRDQAGHLLSYAPQHAASATLDFDHPIGLGAEVSWGFVSSQFTDDTNTLAEDAAGRVGLLPAYHVVDLGLRYRNERSGLRASLTVKNALDDIYVSARRPEGNHAAGFRQIVVGLRWEPK